MAANKEIPVLVGVGVATQREEDPTQAREPADLILDAVQAAGRDCGHPDALGQTQWIAIPKGRWSYKNPAGRIARAIGAHDAETVLAEVGVMQQSLIGLGCRRIAEGDLHTVLVAGGDAGYWLQRQARLGLQPAESTDDDEPLQTLKPHQELRHPVELQAGLMMPVGLYAIVDSAFRHRKGVTLDAHVHAIAKLYARFTEIAAANPHAWDRQQRSSHAFAPSCGNPVHAFPYTKAHCSNWSVDQASALLLMSSSRAKALDIPRDRWIFPLASTESNHMVPVAARVDLGACPGAAIAGQEALDRAQLNAAQLDFIDLYSCFPVAVQLYADALKLPSQRDLTVTGGMPFAGGPYNNYVLQATARMATLLRAHKGTGLVSTVSGVMTKQAFGLWSSDEPSDGFHWADVSDRVKRVMGIRNVLSEQVGEACIAGYTVLGSRHAEPTAIVVAELPNGCRTVAASTDKAIVKKLQTVDVCGTSISLTAQNSFLLR